MALIPTTNGARVRPGNVSFGRGGAEAGVASGRALEQLGQVGTQAATSMMADQTRYQDEERRKAEQLAEAAARQQDMLRLQQTEDQLRDAHDEVATGIQQGTIPKDSADQAWNERSGKIVGEALPGFRDQAKDIARKSLEGMGLRLGNGVRKAREQRDKQDITAGIGQSLEYLQRQFKVDPGGAELQAMQTIDQLGPFSNYNPEQLAKLKQGWKEQVQFTTGYEAISAGRENRKALDAAQKMVNELPDIDPQKRATLNDRAEAYRLRMDQQDELRAQRVQREAERRLKVAEAEFTTFQAMADRGTSLAPEYIDRAMSATAGTPYQAGIKALAQQAKETGGLAAQPITVQREALTQLDALIAQRGRTPELDKRRQQLQTVLNGSEHDLGADPLRAGLERGVITALPPLNMAGGVGGLVEQLRDRSVLAERVQTWAGRPVPPLTQQEAQGLGQMLKTMPADQRATAIQTLAATLPAQQSQALAAQLDKTDRPTAIAFGLGSLRTTFDRPVAELVLKGAEALKAKTIKEEKTPVDGWGARINAAASAVFSNPQQVEMTSEAARFILAGMVSEGAGGSEDDVRRALRLAVGGTIEDRNGQRIVLPAGVERQDLDQRLKNYPADVLGAQLPDGKVYVRGQAMDAAQFLTSLPGAQLRTVGRGRYVVQAGGSVAANAKNQPIVIEVPYAR